MYEKTVDAIPEVVDNYASLIRQVRRDDFYRKFNAKLIFAEDETWEAEFSALQSSILPLITGATNEPECIWLPEGLDSFLDFVDDLGIEIARSASGQFAGFDIEVIEELTAEQVAAGIGTHSLVPLTAWRFGGVAYGYRVMQRLERLQELTATIVATVRSRFAGEQAGVDLSV